MTTEPPPKSKPSSLNPLGKLTPEQLALVDDWLFTHNYSYRDIGHRCQEEFGLKMSRGKLGAYYRFRQTAWNGENRAGTKSARSPVTEAYEQLLQKVSEITLKLADQDARASQHTIVRGYIRLLSAAHREELQQERFSFDRKKWEYDVATECLKVLPELKQISARENISTEEKIRRVRLRLFGSAPCRIAPLPAPTTETETSQPPTPTGMEKQPA